MDEIVFMQLGWNQRYIQDGQGRGECKDGSERGERIRLLGFQGRNSFRDGLED
jgi:hypothetical protein